MRFLTITIMTIVLSVFILTSVANAHYGAKYEPPDGKIYHGSGWDYTGSQAIYEAMFPAEQVPLILQSNISIPGTRGYDVARAIQSLTRNIVHEDSQYCEFSMHWQGRDAMLMLDSIYVYTDEWDHWVDTLEIAFRQVDRPFFFRIGFEFNGDWNPYHPYIYPIAFRQLVEDLRGRGIDNFATVWCYEPDAAGDFADSSRDGWKWYPGDDVVDWFGLDLFNHEHFDPDEPDSVEGRNGWDISRKGRSEAFLRFAEARGKPVFLNELSAIDIDATPDSTDADSADGQHDWELWFEPFFEFIDNHQNIKGWNYINLDWSSVGHYGDMGWQDARLEINSYIRERWVERVSDERFIHAGYDITGQNEPDQGRVIWTSANGVQDFEDWLTDDEAWGSVLENLDVFGFHMNMFSGRNPLNPELVAAFQRRTGKAVGIEAGGLRMHYGQADTCGETAARRELALYGLIARAGGTVDYLNLDSPIGYMLETNDGAYTPSEAARELADYIEIVNASIPGMSIGINEPIPWYSVDEFPSHPAQDRGDLLEILDVMMDTLRARNITIDFFNCDCPYDYALNRNYDGFAKLIRIQEWCHENDLRFGLMYNSARGGAQSDSLFYADVMAYYETLADRGCIPENLLVWSWYEHPTNALPEDEPYTFTYTMREFMRAAGELSVKDDDLVVPSSFELSVYPNPFNSTMIIKYTLTTPSLVALKVFDVQGRLIETLLQKPQPAGSHTQLWDGSNQSSGVYLLRFETTNTTTMQKVLLIR